MKNEPKHNCSIECLSNSYSLLGSSSFSWYSKMNPIKIGKLTIGIFESLLFLSICAKLTHTIDWSWFWVLSPGWIAFSLGAIVRLTEYFLWFIEEQKNK